MIHSAYASVENLWLDIPVGLGIQILGYKQKLTFLGDFFSSLSLAHTHTLAFFPFFFFVAIGEKKRDKTKKQTKSDTTKPPLLFSKVARKK